MRVLLGCALALATVIAPVSASAETLTVEGIYPAGNSDAAALQSIAVERLGGPDGGTLSTLIGDRLRSARVNGESWFTVYSGSIVTEAEAALSGFVNTDVRIDESYDKEVKSCVRRDENRKCIERVTDKVPCDRARIRVSPSLRLVARDGQLLHSGSFEVTREVRFCADENQPSFDPLIDQALAEAADRTRYEFAPEQRREAIRVFESRKGMERDAGKQFREAVRLTKRDENAACDAFASLESTIGGHRSLLYNLGLCAEAAGEFDSAISYYDRSLQIEGDRSYAQAGLNRIAERILALEQIEAHYQ
jgi:tetratricopeptide (TPR) repeat protein